MADRVTVNFYRRDNPELLQWAWFDASGYVPAPGDHVITPAGTRWTVVARTWHHVKRASGYELDCNAVVEDYAEETPA